VNIKADLPDLNVWLSLASTGHQHHAPALSYWEQQASESILFCSITALGLVRLVSQPRLMGAAVKSTAEASAVLKAFCAQPGVGMAEPEHDGWEIFHAILCSNDLPSRHCTDAYLAALAIANGWRLVSFDRDFSRFAGLEWLHLPTAQQ
jgi:toxin-antitoxin system PIN domain toxin